MSNNTIQFNCNAIEDSNKYNFAFVHTTNGSNYFLTRVAFSLSSGRTLNDFEFAFGFIKKYTYGVYSYYPAIVYRTPNISSGTTVLNSSTYSIFNADGTSVSSGNLSTTSNGTNWRPMTGDGGVVGYYMDDPSGTFNTFKFEPVNDTLIVSDIPLNINTYLPADSTVSSYTTVTFPTFENFNYETLDGYTNVTGLPFNFNGQEVTNLLFNGQTVNHLYFNDNSIF